MSQVILYRQYWMATLKDRHCCQICGDLAVNAEYLESDNGVIDSVNWVCDVHFGTSNKSVHLVTVRVKC